MARLLFGRQRIGPNSISLAVTSSTFSSLFIRAAVTSICVHPSNKVALSIGADNAMRMWNLIKGRLGYVRKLKEQAFKILFSPDGSEYFFRFIFILDMQSCIPRCAVCTRSVMENNYSS